ncbi:MAG: hypothetical protein Q9214_000256 [Letrouitia sp. 1 TL-2023]
MDDIPVKLRCAACSKLATNAYRTPCCDQAICEDCQSNLPQACPVCLHEPVKAEDCRPNKPLRATVKAFLKRKLVDQKKLVPDKGPSATPIPATPRVNDTPVGPQTQKTSQLDDEKQGSREPPRALTNANEVPLLNDVKSVPTEAQMDEPQPSIENSNEPIPENLTQENVRQTSAVSEKADPLEGRADQLQGSNSQEMMNQWTAANGVGQGMGFDGLNGGFPNTGFNGTPDMSQMMQFMPNNAMTAFPNIMGMPGMGVDPMQAMSQSMFGGFGGPGMGMNGMNMGMGFPTGQGMFGGFNGQPGVWNAGQDKFNQNAYGGHANGMGGDFGANAGYTGYNIPQHHQGTYNQMNHQQFSNYDFQNGYYGQGFYNRGRGRGRGYHHASRGRGGYSQVNPGNQANNEPFHHQLPPQVTSQDSTQAQQSQQQQHQTQEAQPRDAQVAPQALQDAKTKNQAVQVAGPEQSSEEIASSNVNKGIDALTVASPPRNAVDHEKETQDGIGLEEPDRAEAASQQVVKGEEKAPPLIETTVIRELPKENDHETAVPAVAPSGPSSMLPPPSPLKSQASPTAPLAEQSYDYASRGRGGGRGIFRGTGDFRGAGRGRGTGILPNTNHVPSNSQPSHVPTIPPSEPKGLGVEGAPTGPKAMREGLPNTGMRGGRGFSIIGRASTAVQPRSNGHARSRSHSPARSRSRSRSPSHHHSYRHRSHRHRSLSSSDSSDRERRRERHRRRSRRYEDGNDEAQDGKELADSSSKRSSHRIHRERDDDRDEERGGHRSRRARRERSKERDRDHRSGRKRSRSGHEDVDTRDDAGDSRLTNDRYHEKHYDEGYSSRKRRERDGDDERRERKRSRRDHADSTEEKEHLSRSKHGRHSETGASTNHDRSRRDSERTSEAAESPKPDIDPHELERQARNRERLQKELQRREAMEGKGSSGKRREGKGDGRASGLGRRVSYKYEDEESDEATASRVEREREAGRWG